MKKLIALLLAMVMVLALAACNAEREQDDDKDDKENSSQKNPSSGKEETTQPSDDEQQGITGEITVESLMNYPESPEEDFIVVDGKEGSQWLYEYQGDDDIILLCPENGEGSGAGL